MQRPSHLVFSKWITTCNRDVISRDIINKARYIMLIFLTRIDDEYSPAIVSVHFKCE